MFNKRKEQKMKMRIFTLTGILVLACAGILLAAQPGKEAKFRHADKNKDGSVGKKEMKMEKNWEQKQRSQVNSKWEEKADTNSDGSVGKAEMNQWKNRTQQVNNDVEKRYDTNADGYLQPQESKQMFKDKQSLINTHGKAKVDSALEKEYDTNQDGVIDAKEAEALKEVLK